MGEQYSIPSQIHIFNSLQELLGFVDKSIAENKAILKTYEDELGNLLRQSEQTATEEEWVKDLQSKMSSKKSDKSPEKAADSQQSAGQENVDQSKDKKDKKKEDKKKDKEAKRVKIDKKGKGRDKKFSSQGWVNYRDVSIFNGKTSQGKADVYFGIINEIKTTIEKLNGVKEAVSPLSNLGFSQNVSYLTYVKNGIPERLVLYQGTLRADTKFEFTAQFVGKELQAPVEAV